MAVKNTRLAVTTTGSAGAATGTATTPESIRGKILRVDVNYHASAPATTDIELYQANEFGGTATDKILDYDDHNTDIVIYPRRKTEDNTGADIIYATGNEVHEPYVVCDKLTASVAGADALTDCIVLIIYWEE